MKFIVKQGKTAFISNVRWREGREVDVPDALLKKDEHGKFLTPEWGIPVASKEAKAELAKIEMASKENPRPRVFGNTKLEQEYGSGAPA